MHIEPGLVHGAKMALAFGTAATAAGCSVKLIAEDLKAHAIPSFVLRASLATTAVLVFFEVLPHFPVGVSEVHFILGTTLLLILGAGPAAVGLALGLLVQGLFFAPTDLPMYLVNVSTLLMPLVLIAAVARRTIPDHKPYVDLSFREVLRLSFAYQGGVVAWVAFWAVWGRGTGAENLGAIGSFAGAYMLVVLIEPLADLGALAAAKGLRRLEGGGVFARRLLNPA